MESLNCITKKIANEISRDSEEFKSDKAQEILIQNESFLGGETSSTTCAARWLPIFTIALFFTLYKTTKIRGRVTSYRDIFFLIILAILSQYKSVKTQSDSLLDSNSKRMEISFRLWLMERTFFYTLSNFRLRSWIENWILL